jgi:hypothetical protein
MGMGMGMGIHIPSKTTIAAFVIYALVRANIHLPAFPQWPCAVKAQQPHLARAKVAI